MIIKLKKLLEILITFTTRENIKIIVDSFVAISALTIICSFFSLFLSIPLGSTYTDFLTSHGLDVILKIPIQISTDYISLFLTIVLSSKLAIKKHIDPFVFCLLCTLCLFFIVTPVNGSTPESNYGSNSIFTAIIICFFLYWLYHIFSRKVPFRFNSLFSLLMTLCTSSLLILLITIVLRFFGLNCFNQLIIKIIQAPMLAIGGGFIGIFLSTLFGNLFWFFGIHGGNLVYSITSPIYQSIKSANIASFLQGIPAPSPEWFMNCYIAIGGMGCTLALTFLMIFFSKSNKLKQLGKVCLLPSLFNINEPIIFGCPIAFNAVLIVPFVFCPLVNLILSYVFTVLIPIIPPPTGAFLSFYLPFPFYAAFNSAHFTAMIWSVFLFVLDVFIYYPFFKKYDYELLHQEESELQKGEDQL